MTGPSASDTAAIEAFVQSEQHQAHRDAMRGLGLLPHQKEIDVTETTAGVEQQSMFRALITGKIREIGSVAELLRLINGGARIDHITRTEQPRPTGGYCAAAGWWGREWIPDAHGKPAVEEPTDG